MTPIAQQRLRFSIAMKIASTSSCIALLAASSAAFAQGPTNAYEQWNRASKEANDVFLAGRKVYDSGNAPPTCASALKSQFELGKKVEQLLDTAMQTVDAMGGPNNSSAQAYFASNLRTASSEVVALDSNTMTDCGLR